MTTKITASFVFLMGITLAFYTQVAFSQQRGTGVTASVVEANGGECELNSLHVDALLAKIKEKNYQLLIVSRLGNNELTKSLHQRRIHNAKVVFGKNVKNVKAVEGEQFDGLGRLEFYLDGQLALTSIIRQGKDVCLTCCDPDYRLYPWRAIKKQSRRSR